jgi:hypothetical protein
VHQPITNQRRTREYRALDVGSRRRVNADLAFLLRATANATRDASGRRSLLLVFGLSLSTFTFSAFTLAPFGAIRCARIVFAPVRVAPSLTTPSFRSLRLVRVRAGLVIGHEAFSNTSAMHALRLRSLASQGVEGFPRLIMWSRVGAEVDGVRYELAPPELRIGP